MVDALVGFNAKLSKNRIHLNETIITKLNISKQCRNNGVYSMQQRGAMNICEFLRSLIPKSVDAPHMRNMF